MLSYDLAHKKASRIVNTEVMRTSQDEFQLTVTAVRLQTDKLVSEHAEVRLGAHCWSKG